MSAISRPGKEGHFLYHAIVGHETDDGTVVSRYYRSQSAASLSVGVSSQQTRPVILSKSHCKYKSLVASQAAGDVISLRSVEEILPQTA
jgi:hypothetical protein